MSARRRLLAGVLGVAVLVGAALVPRVQQTEAAWTDAEFATATVTSMTLVTPVITGCTIQNNGLGIFQSVTLVWTAVYPLAGVKLTATSGANSGTISSGISVSGPTLGTYTYTAVLSQALLTSVVTNLLGNTTTLAVTSVIAGTAWTSPAVTRRLAMGLAGLGTTCT